MKGTREDNAFAVGRVLAAADRQLTVRAIQGRVVGDEGVEITEGQVKRILTQGESVGIFERHKPGVFDLYPGRGRAHRWTITEEGRGRLDAEEG